MTGNTHTTCRPSLSVAAKEEKNIDGVDGRPPPEQENPKQLQPEWETLDTRCKAANDIAHVLQRPRGSL